ncbi:phosphatidylethanolamine-binding protein PEBP [Rhodotorula toruloides]|uniref:Phosphatidylethanolamine-binding protein PEBP n=1 Tax=Rhodotorula toruloides TaxID=5286 RepID=A0A0K3CCK4_RHOTO|nr:phosphatidylethanolamine-binding protein PEBP [Rhodotorula toruloides]PRQ78145.1 Phosphatidylethanolamine-binding protein PEBP [Rhodotorula toruloides]
MLCKSTLLAGAFAVLASAQSSNNTVPATADTRVLALTDVQYANSGRDDSGNAGFGVKLNSKALLTVVLSSGQVIQNGQQYPVDQLQERPTVYVTPADNYASLFNSSSKYTLTLADASSLGDADPEGNYRHFLANGLTGAPGSGANKTFTPEAGTTITNYAAPGPLPGTGPHRYSWLLFEEPANFQAPSNLSTSGVSPSHWYVSSYVQQTGIQLVAASFFTVQNGNPTGSVASTAAVNTASLSASSASGSGSAAPSQTSGSSSPSGSSNPSSGAAQIAASLGAGFIGLAGLVALL